MPDASRITPPVLLPGFPNPVRLSAQVELDPAGLTLGAVRSSLHVATEEQVGERLVVRLKPGERADRDFLLRFALGSAESETASLAVVPDADGSGEGTFALTVLPPAEAPAGRPRDVVLVLDRSGSMGGWKMVAARRAAARIIDTLGGADRFAVLTFDSTVESPPELGAGLVEATDRNRFRAVEHLAGVTARGGTEMAGPLGRAADLLADGPDRDRVLVLVTDGQVGNEDQLLRTLAPRLDGLRVHTVGVDRAVNEAFLRRLALLGGGRCELVESEDRLDEAMANIHRRIASPLVLELALDPGELAIEADSVTPARLPSLFAGAPVVVTGRYRGTPAGTVTVRGRRPDGTEWSADVPAVASDNASLAAVWARSRVRDLEDRYASKGADPELERDDRGDLAAVRRAQPVHGLRRGGLPGGERGRRDQAGHPARRPAAGLGAPPSRWPTAVPASWPVHHGRPASRRWPRRSGYHRRLPADRRSHPLAPGCARPSSRSAPGPAS